MQSQPFIQITSILSLGVMLNKSTFVCLMKQTQKQVMQACALVIFVSEARNDARYEASCSHLRK